MKYLINLLVLYFCLTASAVDSIRIQKTPNQITPPIQYFDEFGKLLFSLDLTGKVIGDGSLLTGLPIQAFNAVTAGTNTSALVIGTGGSLAVSGGGTITASATPFSGVSAGTNTSSLVIGTGGSVSVSGSGTISATSAKKLIAPTGAAGTVGTGTANGITEVDIATTAVTASSIIIVTPTSAPVGIIYVFSETPSTGFSIKSTNVGDTAVTFNWMIVN